MVHITTQKIQPLSDRIFVFGSNLAGRHGAGAALHAYRHYGAQSGVPIGHMGQCYAIPTKDQNLRSLDLEAIAHNIKGFLAYAKYRGDLRFNVTQIGCGLAGYKPFQIAPMFKECTENCWFDPAWEIHLPSEHFWQAPI